MQHSGYVNKDDKQADMQLNIRFGNLTKVAVIRIQPASRVARRNPGHFIYQTIDRAIMTGIS